MKKLIIAIFKKLGYTIRKIDDNSSVINYGSDIIKKMSPDFKILNGPFKGIRYPSIDITELTLVPKISGSYEKQLEPVISRLAKIPFNNIIDVGCAEGYYAVGLAKLIPESTVHAYDINEKDLEFCKKMAGLNGVSNITFNKFCSPETLVNFNYGKRSLVFCDCEGYELDLFTKEAVKALGNTEVLVEMHDFVNPVISETLIERFKDTHDIKVINNSNVDYSGLQGMQGLAPRERAFAVYEHRGGLYQNVFMEWGYFTPKNII